MRKSGGWMRQLDEHILEYLLVNGVAFPDEIANHPNTFASSEAVRERAEILAGMGLVSVAVSDSSVVECEICERGTLLELTSEGRLYLRGEFRADLQPPQIDRS